MEQKIIKIGDFTVDNMITFFSSYEKPCEKNIQFDFKTCNKARLLPALVFSSWMKKISGNRSVKNINSSNGASYLKNIGFFKDLKVETFKDQKIYFDTNKKHIPIITFTKKYYKEIDLSKDINDNITDEMRKISCQIFDHVSFENDNNKTKSIDTMAFLLREIVRNVFEHSKSDYHTLAMQVQENNNRIEIAILDEGIGIASSYTSNPLFKNYTQNPNVALKRAISPGSSRMYKNNVEIDRKETTWPNSGFGLFMSSRICSRLSGSFNLISSGYHLRLTYHNDKDKYFDEIHKSPLKGCAIGLEFNLNELSYYEEINKIVLKEVEDLQKGVKNVFENPSSYSNIESIDKD